MNPLLEAFDNFRRRHWLLQFWLCNFGFHLWEPGQYRDWCDQCHTPRE